MGNRRPPCLWLPSETPPVVLGPEFSESPEENCVYMCLHFNDIVWLLSVCVGPELPKISDSAAFIRLPAV